MKYRIIELTDSVLRMKRENLPLVLLMTLNKIIYKQKNNGGYDEVVRQKKRGA